MGLRDFFSKKQGVVKKTPEERANVKKVNTRHRRRIDNLNAQLEMLNKELLDTEQDLEMSEVVKGKKSNKLVQRITLIENEIAIREKLLSWL